MTTLFCRLVHQVIQVMGANGERGTHQHLLHAGQQLVMCMP